MVSVLAFLFAKGTEQSFLPGHPSLTATGWHSDTMVLVQRGVDSFYKVHGRWPESWTAVRQSLVSQAELVGPKMQPVDPDDGKLNFFLDVSYEPGNPPKVTTQVGSKVHTVVLQAPRTYAQQLPIYQKAMPELDADYYLADAKRLTVLAIISQLHKASSDIFSRRLKAAQDIEEVLDSGCSPITAGSINPLTGQRFRFDGSPNDLKVTMNGDELRIALVDDKGNVSTVGGFE